MIQENIGANTMFLKQVRLGELGSLPKIKGGIQVKPLRRDDKEAADMELVIDLARYNVRAGEIGLKLPLWASVDFTTTPTRLVIDIPDSDEEDMCHRNEENPARLAITRLDPKLLDKTSPYVDGLVSSDGRSLTVRAVFNKDSKPSSCDPEIEMMGLGNWDIVNPSPDLDVDVFQSSANYGIKLGKLQLDENELPRDTVLLQKESLEDQVALRPLEVPNVDLAFNFGQEIGPGTRWKFSAKCQKSGVQASVPLEDYVLKPSQPLKVATAPHHFGIQRILGSVGLGEECQSPVHIKVSGHCHHAEDYQQEPEKKESIISMITGGIFRNRSKDSVNKEEK